MEKADPQATFDPCRFCPASFDVRVETLDPRFLLKGNRGCQK